MAELQYLHGPLDDVETMIRMAQDYVCASDDLRPRVLELARAERRARHVRRWFSLWALVFAAVVPLVISRLHATTVGDRLEVEEATLQKHAFSAADPAVLSSDPSWRMVETFTQLRKIQAELLRL